MTSYIIANWAICIATSVLLAGIFVRQRYLLVKPSIVVVIGYHIIIQWPAAIHAAYIEYFLRYPWDFFALAQLFPLVGTAISLFVGRTTAYRVWHRIQQAGREGASTARSIPVLVALVGATTTLYLCFVPLASTGLVTIWNDPARSALAREYSLKLVDNSIVTYSFSFMLAAFAPLLAALLTTTLLRPNQHEQSLPRIFTLALLVVVLFVISLTGARSFAAEIFLIMSLMFLLPRGLVFNPLYLVVGAVLILLPPTLLSILREGERVSLENLLAYTTNIVFSRLLETSMNTGLWHVHFVQYHGFFGVRGLPKLAEVLGYESVNVPNIIGITYAGSRISSISANTSYVFSYYSYFGLASIVPSLLGLLALDSALLVYRRLGDGLLPSAVAVMMVTSLSFAMSDYTTTWLSHGFGVVLLMVLVLDHLERQGVQARAFAAAREPYASGGGYRR